MSFTQNVLFVDMLIPNDCDCTDSLKSNSLLSEATECYQAITDLTRREVPQDARH